MKIMRIKRFQDLLTLAFIAVVVILIAIVFGGCDQIRSMTAPDDAHKSGSSFDPTGPRNLWLSPNVASNDMVDMFRYPDKWKNVRSRTAVMGFYSLEVYGGACPTCGPNVLS